MARQPETWKHDLNPGRAQRPRDIHGTGKLIGLHADECDQAVAAG
jgi:hypothetical protein